MNLVKPSIVAITTALLLGIPTTAMAHEFWIEPLVPLAALDKKITAHVRVGENFKGDALYYLPNNIKNISISNAAHTTKISRLIGDFPVFDQSVKVPGLHILSYQSRPTKITYKTLEKFKKFLTNVGLQWVLGKHLNSGFPISNFSETYTRYAKALVGRGLPLGDDRNLGLPFELIAQTNPYLLKQNNVNSQMSVLLLWKNKPLGNAQVSIFEKPSPNQPIKPSAAHDEQGDENIVDAVHTKLKTNTAGLLTFPVKTNKTYMLNAVQIVRGNSTTDVIWKSFWASLTFTTTK